jgi:hypothetical protein
MNSYEKIPFENLENLEIAPIVGPLLTPKNRQIQLGKTKITLIDLSKHFLAAQNYWKLVRVLNQPN